MDILIKGMEMPTKVNHPLFIRIKSDEHIAKGDFLKGGFIETEAKAVALPSHGDLVEISKVKEALCIHGQASPWDFYVPVILEATE